MTDESCARGAMRLRVSFILALRELEWVDFDVFTALATSKSVS